MSNRICAVAIALCCCFSCALIARGEDAATDGKPPKDAVILFNGKDTSKWQMRRDGGPCVWKVLDDGSMESQGGDIVSKDKFGDFTAHVEFWIPNLPPEVPG